MKIDLVELNDHWGLTLPLYPQTCWYWDVFIFLISSVYGSCLLHVHPMVSGMLHILGSIDVLRSTESRRLYSIPSRWYNICTGWKESKCCWSWNRNMFGFKTMGWVHVINSLKNDTSCAKVMKGFVQCITIQFNKGQQSRQCSKVIRHI